ncbi:transglycosylase domain-containing protein [Flavobacterium sp. 9AF]|uniref:transglycosylase domain-containing protein n=1 Tax=Flavobacterium sp. 9AF TaxID=2653142 RepID=UPI00135BA9DF|nr:transglycosylase domain-containing protein [Flavobacterium sp. 9AF]
MRKKIRNTLVFALSFGLLFLLGFYIYLRNGIDSVMTPAKQEKVFASIQAAPALPESFYEQYEKINPNGLERGYTASLLSRFFGKPKPCACETIYVHPGYFDAYNRFAPPIFMYEATRKVGGKKCLDFALQKINFANGAMGVVAASKQYFQKDLASLTDSEVLDLLLMMENSSYFNLLREKGRERLEQRKAVLLRK